jgi:hypothetical protein
MGLELIDVAIGKVIISLEPSTITAGLVKTTQIKYFRNTNNEQAKLNTTTRLVK